MLGTFLAKLMFFSALFLPVHILLARLGCNPVYCAIGTVFISFGTYLLWFPPSVPIGFVLVVSVMALGIAGILGFLQVHSFLLRAFTLNVLETIQHSRGTVTDLKELYDIYGGDRGYEFYFNKRIFGLQKIGLVDVKDTDKAVVTLTTTGTKLAQCVGFAYKLLGIKNAGF